MVYIGIDPGQKGALAFIFDRNGRSRVIDMPLMPDETEIDVCSISDIVSKNVLSTEEVFCVIEHAQVMPKQGSVGGFNYGVGYGALKATLRLMRIPFEEVKPIKWKKFFSLTTKKKEEKINDYKKRLKQDSVMKCIELFPNIPKEIFYGSKGGIKDGRAEALLLAEYGLRIKTGV